jgi:hypothetical protein
MLAVLPASLCAGLVFAAALAASACWSGAAAAQAAQERRLLLGNSLDRRGANLHCQLGAGESRLGLYQGKILLRASLAHRRLYAR